MREYDNELVWANIFQDMFHVPKQDCTPETILDTMHALTEMLSPRRKARKALTLDDIAHHARIRNINCTDAEVLSCLRTLYRQKKIRHQRIADNHRFLIETL